MCIMIREALYNLVNQPHSYKHADVIGHLKVLYVQLLEEFKGRNMHPGLGNSIGCPP